jgi:hypothetical protein
MEMKIKLFFIYFSLCIFFSLLYTVWSGFLLIFNQTSLSFGTTLFSIGTFRQRNFCLFEILKLFICFIYCTKISLDINGFSSDNYLQNYWWTAWKSEIRKLLINSQFQQIAHLGFMYKRLKFGVYQNPIIII